MAQYIYVSTTGNDANNGASVVTPLRSFKRAMAIAVAGQTVRFVAGTYGSATGDDFAQPVPNGVNLERNGSAGGVTFAASGASLVLAGDAKLSHIALQGFTMPLGITGGTQTLTGVAFVNSAGAVIIAGDARVTMESVSFSGAPSSTEMLLIQDTARLTWSSGNMSSTFTDCTSAAGLRALGASHVSLSGVRFDGKWSSGSQGPAFFDTDGAIKLTTVTFVNECSNTNTSMFVQTSPTATLDIFAGSFGGQLAIQPIAAVKVRMSWFYASAGIYLTGTPPNALDLGRVGDLGGNHFQNTTQAAIAAAGAPNLVIDAAGNEWVPNQQGANGSGLYLPVGTMTLLNQFSGRNFTLASPNTTVRL